MQPINHVRAETLITGRMMHSGTKRPPENVFSQTAGNTSNKTIPYGHATFQYECLYSY